MRKLLGLKVALLVIGLLVLSTVPASAQLGDPLSLAASGVLLPFFSDPASGFVSVFEITSPIVPALLTNPPTVAINPLHSIFYRDNCARGPSSGISETEKQAVALISTAAPLSLNFNGLAAIGQSPNLSALNPLRFPIWTRTFWIDVLLSKLRVLEPIIVDTFYQADPAFLTAVGQSFGLSALAPWPPPLAAIPVTVPAGATVGPFAWNPLRSGASFITPQEGGATGLTATLYLICPRNTIQTDSITDPSGTGGAFPRSRFPTLVNRDGSYGFPPSNVITGNAANTLRALVWDDDETPVRDLTVPCDCLTTRTVASLDAVYTFPPFPLAPFTVPVWYTELIEQNSTWNGVAIPAQAQEFAFTAYWDLSVAGRQATLFHRLSNASRNNLNGSGSGGVTGAFSPFNNR